MALTDTEKADLRKFLGYTDLDQGFYSDVEGSMVAVSDEGIAQLRVLLSDLALIEGYLRSSWKRQKASRVEDIHLAGPDEIRTLREEGNRLASNCASILGLRVNGRYFSSSGGSGGSSGYACRG